MKSFYTKKEIRREIRSLRREVSRLIRKARWETKNGSLHQSNLDWRVAKKKKNKILELKEELRKL